MQPNASESDRAGAAELDAALSSLAVAADENCPTTLGHAEARTLLAEVERLRADAERFRRIAEGMEMVSRGRDLGSREYCWCARDRSRYQVYRCVDGATPDDLRRLIDEWPSDAIVAAATARGGQGEP